MLIFRSSKIDWIFFIQPCTLLFDFFSMENWCGIFSVFFSGDVGLLGKRLVFLDEVWNKVEEEVAVDYRRGTEGVEWRAMISMELPGHASQHGALHLGVSVNPGDPAGTALAVIHSHQQDPLGLHHHHGGGGGGGMHEEDSEKKRTFLLSNPKQKRNNRHFAQSVQWKGIGTWPNIFFKKMKQTVEKITLNFDKFKIDRTAVHFRDYGTIII